MTTSTIDVNGKTIWVTAEPVRSYQSNNKAIRTVPGQYYGYYRYEQPSESVLGNQLMEDGTPKIFDTPEQILEYVRSLHNL
jgi:hypothetical protein